MPRKGSRKSILEKKPKLEFIKSPVQGDGCPVSPVFGALHPLTARVRSANESNLSWISPNFQELARRGLSTSKLRVLRGHRHVTRQRHASNDKENVSMKRTALGRLKPLMFVRDDSEEDSYELLQSLTPPRDQSDHVHPGGEMDIPTPEFTGKVCETEHPVSEGARTRTRSHDPTTDKLPLRDAQSRRSLAPTPSCERHQSTNTRKRMNLGESFGESPSVAGTKKIISGDKSCLAPNLIESPLRILNFSCDDDKCVEQSQRRSTRLKEKYLESVKLLQTPPKVHGKEVKVLVADTPESEYGLRLRGRQLSHIKAKMLAKVS